MSIPIYTTNEELTAAGRYWQRQLRLEDWDIEYSLRRCGDVFGEGHRDGSSYVTTGLKTMRVSVIQHDNYSGPGEYDMEWVLVHELMHLHYIYGFEHNKENPIHALQEASIDQVAKALVNLNRGSRR